MSDERRALRELGEWRPQAILRRLGPPPSPSHTLAHLIVAQAVVQGPDRLHNLLRKLEAEGRRVLPRMNAVGEEAELVAGAAAELDATLRQMSVPRARIANEAKGGVPVGMNGGDLRFLAELTRVVITGAELMRRPGPAGVARTQKFLANPPVLLDALAWAGRLNPFRGGPSAHLSTRDGRVVVAFDDGRVAYDPRAFADDED